MTKSKSTKGGDVRQTCRPLIKPYEHEGRDIRQTLRARREGTYDKPLGLSSNPTSRSQHDPYSGLENLGLGQIKMKALRGRATQQPLLSVSHLGWSEGGVGKSNCTKGEDIRQTSKINPHIAQCFGILCKQKKRDIRQSRRARREGTYDKPLKIKPQFRNSWDSLQADKEGHTTKPTSTKGGDIRQNLRARREGTYDKPVDLSSNPTSMKGGTYDKPYEHEERGHTTNL